LTIGTAAEGLLGTDIVRGLDIPKTGNTQFTRFSEGPSLVGSLNTEKQFTIESLARQHALDEAQRRSFATRSLSFQ